MANMGPGILGPQPGMNRMMGPMHRFPPAFGRGGPPPNQQFPPGGAHQPNQFHPRMQRPQLPPQANDSTQERRIDPRLNNRPGASTVPGGPPSQPRNYREYRMMKEEQERKRKDAEEKHRLQMQKYERKSDSIEEKTAAAHEKEDEKEKNTPEKSTLEKQNDSTKKGTKDKKDMIEKSKDQLAKPGVIKQKEAKKMSNEEESKAIEQVKKTFKIPKMKKKDPPSDEKVDEKSKPKTFDMFNSENMKVSKEKSKEINITPKESEKIDTDKSESVKKSRILSRFNSDSSDSDQGLVIAESSDMDSSVDEAKKKVEEKKVTKKDEKPDHVTTKELLKSIVAKLKPSEAAELLLKAQNLDKLEKLTLQELKDFLLSGGKKSSKGDKNEVKKRKEEAPATKNDENEANISEQNTSSTAKKTGKKTPPPTPVKEVSKGSRRSGRLSKISDDKQGDDKEEANEIDSDAEFETLIIDPKPVKRKVKEKRKAKKAKDSASNMDDVLENEDAPTMKD